MILIRRAEKSEDDTGLRVDTDGRYDHPPASFHDVCTGEQHRISSFALFDLIRFARHGRLVHFQVVALNEDAIGRQQIAVFHLHIIESTNQLPSLSLSHLRLKILLYI